VLGNQKSSRRVPALVHAGNDTSGLSHRSLGGVVVKGVDIRR
jgi:hypothetical protein